MTATFVLVHGAWHGSWAWDRVVPLLQAAGATTLVPDLDTGNDHGLHDDAKTVVAAIDSAATAGPLILVGHSYAGLVVREAADARPDAVAHLVLIDGWAGPDGSSLFGLAPDSFEKAIRATATSDGQSPAPPPAAFGVTAPDDAAWLAEHLLPQPLRTFTEPTRLTGAVDRIPGTAICCRPPAYPFDKFAEALGYPTVPLDAAHNVMLTDPEALARLLLRIG